MAIGQLLHHRVSDRNNTIVARDAEIVILKDTIKKLETEVAYQIELRDDNRLKLEQARMILDEQQTMTHHFKKEVSDLSVSSRFSCQKA